MIGTLKFILQNYYSPFDETYYCQKFNTTMGTKATQVLANLITGYFEFTIYEMSLQNMDIHFTIIKEKTGKKIPG